MMRCTIGVKRQQNVHHLTGTGIMQYMQNRMKRLYQTMMSPYSWRRLSWARRPYRVQPKRWVNGYLICLTYRMKFQSEYWTRFNVFLKWNICYVLLECRIRDRMFSKCTKVLNCNFVFNFFSVWIFDKINICSHKET